MEDKIYSKLKELQQSKIHFKDIPGSEIDSDRPTFDEMVSFYKGWLPDEGIEFADGRDFEIEGLVNFELFLTKKLISLQKEDKQAIRKDLQKEMRAIYQKESYLRCGVYGGPLYVRDYQPLVWWLRIKNIFTTEEESVLTYNAWADHRMIRRLSQYYGKKGWEGNKRNIRSKKLGGLLRELTIASYYSNLRKAIDVSVLDVLKFHDITKHTEDFAKRERAEKIYKQFFSDIVKETLHRSKNLNGQEKNLVNTLIRLEKQIENFLQDKNHLFNEDKGLCEDILSQIDKAFSDIKNNLPPPLINKDCYGDRHAIYIAMELIFKDDKKLTEQ